MNYIQKDFKDYINNMDFKDYSIIDPPWRYNDIPPCVTNKQLTYSLWNDNYENLNFIFNKIKTNYLFLWVTNSMLDIVFKSFHSQQQFIYKTCVVWNKLTSKGNLFYGLGNTFRNSTELLLVFQKEKCKPLRLNFRTSIYEESKKRTIKPKIFESQLINELNKKGFKGTYIFCGYDILKLNLDIDCVDIIEPPFE